MPSPYDSLLGLSPDPFGDLMETSLGGLAYLGKVADKTFGARALRGVLAGKPEELLSVLPFSDTIGDLTQQHFGTRIGTDERNAVQGTVSCGPPGPCSG